MMGSDATSCDLTVGATKLAVRQSPVSKDLYTEAEESTLLEAVT
jgi:hypothetical protein